MVGVVTVVTIVIILVVLAVVVVIACSSNSRNNKNIKIIIIGEFERDYTVVFLSFLTLDHSLMLLTSRMLNPAASHITDVISYR